MEKDKSNLENKKGQVEKHGEKLKGLDDQIEEAKETLSSLQKDYEEAKRDVAPDEVTLTNEQEEEIYAIPPEKIHPPAHAHEITQICVLEKVTTVESR